MSNRIRRVLSLCVLGLLLTLSALVIMANVLVTPERVRDVFVPVVEKYLKCDVNLEAIDVSLLSGVALTNLELLKRSDHGLIMAADKVILRYRLWPLLLRRVVIDEARLENPRLNVERYADGRLNLHDLIEPSNDTHQAAAADAVGNQQVDVVISQLYINRGELLFKDYSLGTAPHRYKFTDFDLHLGNFSLKSDFSVKLWGKLDGAPLDIAGVLNLAEQRYDVNIIAENINLVPYQRYYQESIKHRLNGLTLTVDSRLWGNLQRFSAQGSMQLQQLDLVLSTAPKYPLLADIVDLDYQINFDRVRHELELAALRLNYAGVPANLVGRIDFQQTVPQADLRLILPNWSLRSVLPRLPAALGRALAGYDLAGAVDGQLVLRGEMKTLKSLLRQATLTLNAVQASVGGLRPAFSGAIHIEENRLHSESLVMTLGDNITQLKLDCANWQAQRPFFNARIYSKAFDLARLSAVPPDTSPTSWREIIEPGPLSVPVDMGAELLIDSLRWQQIALSQVRGTFELRNSVLEYQHFSGQVAGGFFDFSGQLDLKRQGFAYAGHGTVRQAKVETLQRPLVLSGGEILFGTLTAELDYSGAGTQKLRLQQNLLARGTFQVENGKMAATQLTRGFAEFMQLPELTELSFEQFGGSFSLATGAALHVDGHLLSQRLRLYPVGDYSLDGALALDVDVQLPAEVLARSATGSAPVSALHDQEGWWRLPLQVSGTLRAPRFNIHPDATVRDENLEGSSSLPGPVDFKRDIGSILKMTTNPVAC